MIKTKENEEDEKITMKREGGRRIRWNM